MTDDKPMHISGKLFIGSIDAARNVEALKRLRIGGALALLGKGEEENAVSSHSSALGDVYEETTEDTVGAGEARKDSRAERHERAGALHRRQISFCLCCGSMATCQRAKAAECARCCRSDPVSVGWMYGL